MVSFWAKRVAKQAAKSKNLFAKRPFGFAQGDSGTTEWMQTL